MIAQSIYPTAHHAKLGKAPWISEITHVAKDNSHAIYVFDEKRVVSISNPNPTDTGKTYHPPTNTPREKKPRAAGG